jgi:hypothetical protein
MGLASLTGLPTFDPKELLIGCINSEVPIEEAAKEWMGCMLALTTLQDQTQ